MKTKTVYVVGNDGSGKSTFTRRLVAKAQGRGLRVVRRHYYTLTTRRLFRVIVEKVMRPSRIKADAQSPGERSPRSASSGPRPLRRGPVAKAMLAFLWGYELAMAIEMRLRDWFCAGDLILMDRSYVDDLVSTAETLRLKLPEALIRCAARWSAARQLVYLSAGHEVEFGRIVDLDLTAELHRRKGEAYEQMIRTIEETGVRVRRINTGPRTDRGAA